MPPSPRRATGAELMKRLVEAIRLTSAAVPSPSEMYRSGLLRTFQHRMAAMLPAAKVSVAKSVCGVRWFPGKMPTPSMPTPRSAVEIGIAFLCSARYMQYAATMASSPAPIMDQLKMAAEGCRMMLSGRMAPRSLTVLRLVL